MFIFIFSASDVVSCNAAKRAALKESLERQQKKNESVDQHRSHVVASAGLTGDSSNELTSNICDFVNDTNQEIEKLSIKIAQATQKYKSDLNHFRTEMESCGVTVEEINSLNVVY